MKRTLFVMAAFATISMVNAQSLFNNAAGRGLADTTGLVTEARAAGGSYSVLQGTNTFYGFSGASVNGFRMGDDFTVTAGGWNVSSVVVFAYQTFATGAVGAAGTITGGTMEIRSGTEEGAVVGSGTFGSAVYTDIYRTASVPLADNRQVQMVTMNFSSLFVGAGAHWITFDLAGSTAFTGPWLPALTKVGSVQPSGSVNARQYNPGPPGTWDDAVDTGSLTQQDLPFYINGQAVPEPASMVALGLGAAALLRRRKRA